LVLRQGLEVVMSIERRRVLVDGIDHNDSATGASSCLEDDEQCLDQKLRAESRSLHR
jgi:hypothetical protein